MKYPTKLINKLITLVLALCAFFGITAKANAQTVQLTVDPTQNWIGYVNATGFNGTDLFNSSYGTAALQAYFAGTNLFLLPCTNVWETTDTKYVQANGETPNAIIDANMYVQNDALVNDSLTFSGTCLTNTLTTQPEPLSGSNYTSVAFIKAFNSSYSVVGQATQNLVGHQPFSISLNTSGIGAAHIQYGFETIGPDANPSANLGDVVVATINKTIPAPTSNAPTPTNTANVVAMYDSSGVYPEVSVDDWDASWSNPGGPNGEAPYTITNTGKIVLKYTALEDAGVEFYDPIGIDTLGCNTMHVDVWTPNANQLGIDLVSLDNGGTQGATVNITPASGTIVSNQWISLNIPLSQFLTANPLLDLTNLQQMLWIDNQGGGATGGTFYFDNVYFYSNSTAPPPPPPPASPTNDAATPTASSALAIWDSSGVYGEVEVKDYDASWSSAGEASFTITNTGAIVLEYVSLQYAGVEMPNNLDDQIDVSSFNTMHVDVWTPNANQFGIQLVSLDDISSSNTTQAAQVNFFPASGTIVSNKWVGLDIPLSSFTAVNGTLDLTDLQQLLWIDNQAGGVNGGIFYIDNVYFYNSTVAQRPPVASVKSSGTITISFPTESGFNYTVQYTTSLTNPSWQTLSTGSNIAGNNYVQTATDTIGTTTRFYRVIVTP